MLENDTELYLQSIQIHNSRIEASIVDPVYHSFVLPQQLKVRELLWKDVVDEIWVLGGNRCYSLSTTYVFDPVFGGHRKASEIDSDFHVYAWDEELKETVIAKAERPFIKGYEEMFRVRFSDGQSIDVTANHRFLMPDGSYRQLRDIPSFGFVAGLSCIGGSSRTDTQRSCARTDLHKAEDSMDHCSSNLRQCGEQPPLVEGNDQAPFQRSGDVLRHSHDHTHLDGEEYKSPCSYHRTSILDSPESESRASLSATESCCERIPSLQQCSPGLIRVELTAQPLGDACQTFAGNSDLDSLQSLSDGSKCLLLPSLYNSGKAQMQSVMEKGHGDEVGGFVLDDISLTESKQIVEVLSRGKELVGDFTVPYYENYYAHGVFNHNSGKSRSAAWMVMQALLENPNTEIICWAQNEDASVERQQPYLWEMMPAEFKKKTKDGMTKINYSKATGFTGNKFIFPNGSVCYFKFYTQFQNDDSVIEGAKLGAPKKNCKFINIGTWCDEYLGDETLLKRLRSRCGDFDAKILVTFTPLRGYTPTVGSMLDGAKTVESLPASLLGGEMMPYVQEPSNRPNMAVVYYHSERNPFSNWERLARNHANASIEEIKKVLYGYPTKSMTAMFNTFDQTAHIYDPAEEHFDFSNSEWTNYQVIDPAGAKSWCCAWFGVNSKGDVRQWAEWPDRDTYGEWAVEGKSTLRSDDSTTWKKGPAAIDNGGMSLRAMEIEWTKIEAGIPIFERIIDVRFAHNPHQTADDGKKTLQDELTDIGIETVASFGATEEVGLPKIQEWLAFDSKQDFHPFTNSPIFRISKACGNSIFSYMNYCKNGKKDEPLKDFIDTCRYAATHESGGGLEHYNEKSFAVNMPKGPMY